MKMTSKLADMLMDSLFCLAISAYAGVSVNERGDISIDDRAREVAERYTKETFVELCHSWEEVMGEEWEIEE